MLAIYCRISVDRPNQKSIKEQQLLGIEFAKANRHSKYQIYTDKGISGGGDISKRPEFEKLINDIHDDKITDIFVWNTDRTQREEITWFTLANLVVDKSINFYENGLLVDLDDPNIYFMYGLKSQMDAMYRKVTSKKIKAILRRNVSEGKTRGILPYGYKGDSEGFMVVNEDEAKVVRRIYEMSLNGIGTNKIAEVLTNDGVPTRYNKIGEGTITTINKYTGKETTTQKKDVRWAGNTIRNIIINPIYKGERHFSGEVYDVASIVTPQYWKKVKENLSKNANNRGKKVTYRYLLKGLIRCGKCGRNYYGRTRKDRKDHYYMCSSKRIKNENCGNRSINIDFIEDFIWNKFFQEDLLRKEIIDYFEKADEKKILKSMREELKELKILSQKLEDEKSRVSEFLVKGIFEPEEAEEQLSRIRREKNEVDIKLSNAKHQIEFYEDKSRSVESITEDLENIQLKSSFNDKKKLVNEHVENIDVLFEKNSYSINVSFKAINNYFLFVVDRNYKTVEVEMKNIFAYLEEHNFDNLSDWLDRGKE